jgi:mannose/fructose-specific phosphotransferase system component IIA
MVGVLIISHGRLATELLAAARTIEPALTEQSRAITLEWNLDPEAGRRSPGRSRSWTPARG